MEDVNTLGIHTSQIRRSYKNKIISSQLCTWPLLLLCSSKRVNLSFHWAAPIHYLTFLPDFKIAIYSTRAYKKDNRWLNSDLQYLIRIKSCAKSTKGKQLCENLMIVWTRIRAVPNDELLEFYTTTTSLARHGQDSFWAPLKTNFLRTRSRVKLPQPRCPQPKNVRPSSQTYQLGER